MLLKITLATYIICVVSVFLVSIVEVIIMLHEEQDIIQTELANERLRHKMLHTMIGSGSWSMTYNEEGVRESIVWSDKVRQLLGFSNEEDFPNTFESWLNNLYPDDREAQLKKVVDYIFNSKPGEVYDTEYRFVTKNRGVRWFRVVGDIIRWPNGKPRQFFGGCIDINVQKEYDILLKEKVRVLEERIQQQEVVALEKETLQFEDNNRVPSGMWSITLTDNKIKDVYWSREFRRMLGYLNDEELPGKLTALYGKIHPFDREKVEKNFWDTINQDIFSSKEFDIELRILRRNGKYHWFHAQGNVKRQIEGTEGNFVGKLEDINDKKEREIMLEQQERDNKIISVLASEYMSVYYIDLQNEDLLPYSMNSDTEMAFGSVFRSGIKYSEALRMYVDRFVDKQDAEKLLVAGSVGNIIRKLSDKSSFSMTYRNIVGRYCEMKVIKASSEEKATFVVLAFADCDAQVKNDEKQKRKIKAEKRKAETANEEKGIFIYNLSHDCGVRLDKIMEALRGIKNNCVNNGCLDGYIAQIEEQGGLLKEIIDDSRAMALVDRGHVIVRETKINLPDYMEMIVDVMREDAAKKELDYKLELRQMISPSVYMDGNHVEQILKNILSNAIKYTDSKGTVRCIVEQEIVPDDPDKITCRFIVEDTGIGMSQNFVKRIYDIFSREWTESDAAGTGIGMAVVKRFVELLNGRIDIKSEKGKGTTVVFEIDCHIM